jgi:hypothetical protein
VTRGTSAGSPTVTARPSWISSRGRRRRSPPPGIRSEETLALVVTATAAGPGDTVLDVAVDLVSSSARSLDWSVTPPGST